jgi:hypothetical protein
LNLYFMQIKIGSVKLRKNLSIKWFKIKGQIKISFHILKFTFILPKLFVL